MAEPREVPEWLTMTSEQRAVALIAEAIAKEANLRRRWWQRTVSLFDAIPAAREAVAVLLLLPEGRELSRRILAGSVR